MTRRTVVVLFMMFFALGLWADSAKGADAPTLKDLKELSVISVGLGARGKIEKYVEHWVERMKKAGKVVDVVKARKALADGYNAHNTQPWRAAYAEISAEKIPAILLLPDRVKQIQASMTIAAMPRYTIQPALEKMARHKNSAVRYWAARGYRSSARNMLLFPERVKKMCVTLERLGKKESGPVLAVVLQALSTRFGGEKETLALLQSAMDKVWFSRLGGLRAGSIDVIEAYHSALAFLPNPDEKNKKDRKKILQLLIDALEASSQGFVELVSSKKSARQPWMDLMSDLESKLAMATRTDKTPIQSILSEPDTKKPVVQKAAEIRLKAVLEYWRPMLTKLGVKPRPAPAPKKKTVPTTTTAPAKT